MKDRPSARHLLLKTRHEDLGAPPRILPSPLLKFNPYPGRIYKQEMLCLRLDNGVLIEISDISPGGIIVQQTPFVEGRIKMKGSGSLLSLMRLTLLQNEYGTLVSNLFWGLSSCA